MSPNILYGCCVGDWDRFYRNVAARVAPSQVIALAGQPAIAAAYNNILKIARDRGCDALVLLHDDLEIVDPDAEEKIYAASRTFNISGVIGTPAMLGKPPLAWWNAGLLGYQQTDSGPVGPGGEGHASALDGSILIFGPWTLQKWNHRLWFDEIYPGFHGYDVDICQQARHTFEPVGGFLPVGVIDLATHHHSTLGFKSQQIAESWAAASEIYDAKWRRYELAHAKAAEESE